MPFPFLLHDFPSKRERGEGKGEGWKGGVGGVTGQGKGETEDFHFYV